MDKETLIIVDCDQECKWRLAVDELLEQRVNQEELIMLTERDDEQSTETCTRLTEAGYDKLRTIQKDYLGISVVGSIGATCTRACSIERYLESHTTVGIELTKLNDNLKGNNNGR